MHMYGVDHFLLLKKIKSPLLYIESINGRFLLKSQIDKNSLIWVIFNLTLSINSNSLLSMNSKIWPKEGLSSGFEDVYFFTNKIDLSFTHPSVNLSPISTYCPSVNMNEAIAPNE